MKWGSISMVAWGVALAISLLPWIAGAQAGPGSGHRGGTVGLAASSTVTPQVAQRVGPPPPPAARRGPFRRPVEIRMMVIHASNDFVGYDRAIVHLRRHLAFLNYRGFRLLYQNEVLLRPGATRRMGLFDGNTIEVTLKSATWERAELHIRMFNRSRPSVALLDTIVLVTRRGTFFVGGPRYNGGVLILPITAWY